MADPVSPRPGLLEMLCGLLRAAMWPGVALAALLMLGPPLAALMQRAGGGQATPQAVSIAGDFRVVLRKGKLHSPPSPSVAQALAQIDETQFRTLIDHPEGGHPVCRDPTDPARIRVKARYDGLVRIGLAEYRAYEGREAWCDSRIDLVYLTELGHAARGYFQNLLLELVQVTR